MTPLKKRMKEELVLRGYSDQTIDIDLSQVARLARHFNRSPDGLDDEQLRAYVLHLHERGLVLDLEPVTGAPDCGLNRAVSLKVGVATSLATASARPQPFASPVPGRCAMPPEKAET